MSELQRADSTAALQRGFRLSGWTIDDLWVAAIGIGGRFDRRDITSITAGARSATPAEHDVLAAALNDHLVDHEQGRPVAFWHDLAARS